VKGSVQEKFRLFKTEQILKKDQVAGAADRPWIIPNNMVSMLVISFLS